MPVCANCGQENPEGARFCLACATPLLGGSGAGSEERKVVTVLFCDLVGFTAVSDLADPEDIRARLRPYHARVRQEIERFGGTLEKFIGDAVMAVFGAPVSYEDDAERAVRAGLRLLDAIEELNRSRPGLDLAVRIGINTGEAVVSLAGSHIEGESLAVGDVVNTAARLQSIAPVGAVVAGETTYRTTRDLFDYEELESVAVKGKARPIRVWHAGAARRGIRSYPEPLGLLPFFDRDHELKLLGDAFARAMRERSLQVVTLVGEPGVGKTRLVREFSQWGQASGDGVSWRYGRCLPYGEGITFWPLGEVVKAQAGVLESDSPEEAGRKLDEMVRDLHEEPGEREWVRQGLAPLLGLPQPDAGPIERSERYAAWRRFLEAMASKAPLAVIFEDLHWADQAMLEFLHHLAEWSADVPMLILCTARPELYEREPGWGGGMRNATTISLSPLGDEEIKGLVSVLLPGTEPDPAILDLILGRSGGNPLYAEEFARMLGERNLDADQISESRIILPESIHAIIAARLDTLSPDRKALLQDAAVVGRVFWSGAVAVLSGRDEREVRDVLHELARKELVRAARATSIEGQAQYTFWHGLIRDVAYSQIPRSARARKHQQMAEWTAVLAGDRVADHAELLAHHYGQALELAEATGDKDGMPRLRVLAARYLEMAGDRALGLDARRAARHFGRALSLQRAAGGPQAALLVKAADADARAGRFTDAEAAYQEAIDALTAEGDRRGAGAAMVKLSILLWHRGETARCREVLGQSIELLEREPPGPELAHAYAAQAEDHLVLGLYQEALRWAKRALSLMESLDAHEQAPLALSVQGFARWYLGDATGIDDIRSAAEMANRLGTGRDAARLQAVLGELLWVTEGPETGLATTEAAVEAAEKRGHPDLAMALHAEMFGPLFDLGQWDRLLDLAARLSDWSRTAGEGYFSIQGSVSVAHVRMCRGDVAGAADLVRGILPAARQIQDPQVLVDALAVAALVEQAAGRGEDALELMGEFQRITRERPTWFRAKEIPELVRLCAGMGSLDMASELMEGLPVHARRHKLSVLTATAVLKEAEGDGDGALAAYEEAAEGWRSFGYVLEMGRTALGAGRRLVDLGKPDAIDRLREARDAFVRLGAAPLLAETESWLARAAAKTP
jgi:class 3 adenylate cyclase/tetratricopeptide (TPR) repeat protein